MSKPLEQKYMLGIDVIDEQHNKLVSIGSRLLDLAELGDAVDHYDDMIKIVNELKEYSEYHFKTEEELFSNLDYKNKDVHIIEHEFFVRKIEKFLEEDFDENQTESLKKMVDFVMGWVLHHILNTDNEYADIINN